MNFDVTNRRSAGEGPGRPDDPSGPDQLGELVIAAHLLTNCDEFLVDDPAGAIGVVDEVQVDRETGIAEVLSIRAGGWLRPRIFDVPVGAVAEVFPAQRRLVLREPLLRRRGRRAGGRSWLAHWFARIRRS